MFSVQNFFQAGYEGEIRQGSMLADLAEVAGVSHFVYSSVGSAYRHTGIHHFESKRRIEEHLRTKELPYTILRPVFFMHNWVGMREQILSGTFSSPLSPEKPLQQLAVEDLGAVAAKAFESPERWIGREFDIAGDELTMPGTASAFARITGREVRHVRVPWEEFRQAAGQEIYDMYRWFEQEGYEADIGAVRSEYPELSTLADYFQRHDWGV